ncbi:class I SAM-dependent methyltransferase [uncultured Alsobacter sp.]|uniref:class I SAM-dependent methyltransferase n=1 Tax=uncultured Alsobacter sp. TaxID=1748258 RepID=UPI0025EB8BF0|nr:class I SAM-dependent methyltransferase [uncultured Alsobacter sp.]
MFIPTGDPTVDHYIEKGYGTVRGMSSQFAASIGAALLQRQAELGLSGHFAEIGTFEGRFFIAMALALQPGEKALGIDLFDWPNDRVMDLLLGHCARHGVGPDRHVILKRDSRTMAPAELQQALGGGSVRFFHIDGEHGDEALTKDLALALPLMHPQGLICLDDMLHPAYPRLVDTVDRWLDANKDWQVLMIIDREDIVAAAKYVLCRRDAVSLYEDYLLQRFEKNVFILGGDFLDHIAVVLTPYPRLAEVD